MAKTVEHDARKGQGAGAHGGSTRKPVGGIAASTRGSKTRTLTLTPQEGARNRPTGQEGAPEAVSSRSSARRTAAQGPRVAARSTRGSRVAARSTQTPKTRESRAGASAKPASTRRKSHSCATSPSRTTFGDYVDAARQGRGGFNTSGGDAPMTSSAPRSVAFRSTGTADVFTSNPYFPLSNAPEAVPTLCRSGRNGNEYPALTDDAAAAKANVASAAKRGRRWSELTRSSSAPRSPSPSSKREKLSEVNEGASKLQPLSRPKTRAAAAAVADEAIHEAVHDPDPAAVVATGISSQAAVDPGPRRSGRNHVTAVVAPRSTRGAAAVAAPRGNAATTVAPHITRAKLAESGRIAREMQDALLKARDIKRPSTPVPDAAEVEARRAADAARNTEADRFLAASLKKYMDGPPVTYGAAVKDILAEYQAVVNQWDADTAPSTPKPEALKKTPLTAREQAGVTQMQTRWQGVARAHLEYGVPPPHSFPFQEWARLDDALTALANDCPAMTTLRQAGSFLGVFLTDGHLGGDCGKFYLKVASANFCIATRDALSSCIEWRVFQGDDFGPLPHDIERMKISSESSAVFQGLEGPYIQKCSNDAPCPHYRLESVTAFARSTAHFYPTRGASRSRSGDSGCKKKRVPRTWLGSSRRAVQLGLAATPGFEDGEMAGDGSVSASDGISIAHMDVTQSEIEFLLDLKAQRLRRDGSSGKLRYGGFRFVSGESGIECTEAALTAAGHRAVGSSVRRSATIRVQDFIGSLPPRHSICARAYAYKLRHFEDLSYQSMSGKMRAERAWDVFSIAKMRVVDELTTEEICIRLREERQQPCLKLEEVKSMLLTAVGEVTIHSNPGVGLWPSPVQKTSGVGSRLSHRIETIRALNANILKQVRDAGVAAIAHFKHIFGAALERDCFLMDWDNLKAIVPICMVNKADDGTRYSPEEQTDQIAYTSRSRPYPPCEPPPPVELLEELRRRSPEVIKTRTMKLLGDRTVWTRQQQPNRLGQPARFIFLHIATGFTADSPGRAEKFHAKIIEYRAAGIVCGKDSITGQPHFSHADGWSTRGMNNPVQSATSKCRSILKERER
jgi:hypothetical protein